jgi:hypothetical protein
MSRSAPRPLLGLVVATLALSVALAIASGGTGCATQETTRAPDAALPPCEKGPFIFCQPAPPDVPGCNTDEGASRWLTRLPKNTRYPVGCVIDYVGERDEQGDCKLEAVCKCVMSDSVPPPPPPPPSDGGSDADASVEAGAPSPAPSDAGAPSPGPVWNCYP